MFVLSKWLCVCLSVSALAPPTPAVSLAPWDGIVGFLQTVARLPLRHSDFLAEDSLEDHQPLRKIVYAVEEQITVGNPAQAPPQVVFDSATPATANHSTYFDDSVDEATSPRLRRSPAPSNRTQAADVHHSEGRASPSIANRPIFLGRNLWYAPLWFGLYLIVYILVLTVKSVARHRIRYPTLVPAEKSDRRRGEYNQLNGVENAITSASRRYQTGWQ